MAEKVTFGDLHRLLEESGFEPVSVNGPYILFEHANSGALQAFRAHRANEIVDPMTLASVRKTLVGFGFIEENEFDKAVREVCAERHSKLSKR